MRDRITPESRQTMLRLAREFVIERASGMRHRRATEAEAPQTADRRAQWERKLAHERWFGETFQRRAAR